MVVVTFNTVEVKNFMSAQSASSDSLPARTYTIASVADLKAQLWADVEGELRGRAHLDGDKWELLPKAIDDFHHYVAIRHSNRYYTCCAELVGANAAGPVSGMYALLMYVRCCFFLAYVQSLSRSLQQYHRQHAKALVVEAWQQLLCVCVSVHKRAEDQGGPHCLCGTCGNARRT
jgi:hypothetical protein